MKAWRNST